jgi:hypothetical protein
MRGLFLRTLRNLVTLDAGFATSNVLRLSVDVRAAGHAPSQRAALYDRS